MNEHERAFVKEFITPRRRDRYFQLLSAVKRRGKFRNRIAHALVLDLDSRYLHEEDDLAENIANTIRHLLERAGHANASCYVMCENATLDAQEMTLGKAEAEWDALCGIIISVVPGNLVYYRPERPGKNYVLLKE
jgi:hypothetical protein